MAREASLSGDSSCTWNLELPPFLPMPLITQSSAIISTVPSIKYIYGLVQAVRKYHKKVDEVLYNIGFNGREVDPCLFWTQ